MTARPEVNRATLVVIGASAWITAGLAVQGLGRLVFLALVGRCAPAAMADVAAALAMALIATLCWPSAAGNAALRFLSVVGEEQSRLPSALASTTAGVAVSAGLLAGPIGFVLTGDPLTAGLAAVLVAATAWYGYARPALVAHAAVRRVAGADAVGAVVTLGTVPVLVLLDAHSSWWLLPPVLGQLAACALTWPTGARLRLGLEWAPGVVRFIRHNTMAVVASGALLPAATLATRTFDPAQAGAFAAAVSLATPINMLSQSLSQVLIPRFARLGGGRVTARVHREAGRLFWLTTVSWLLLFGVAVPLAGGALGRVYGGNFDHATPMLQLLLVATAVHCLITVPLALLVATGRERMQARIVMVCTLGGLVVMLATPVVGVGAALAGYCLGAAAAGVITAGFALRPVAGEPDPDQDGCRRHDDGRPTATVTAVTTVTTVTPEGSSR